MSSIILVNLTIFWVIISAGLSNVKEYTELVNSVPENKPYNKLGSAINRIMCYYENLILQNVIHIINKS